MTKDTRNGIVLLAVISVCVIGGGSTVLSRRSRAFADAREKAQTRWDAIEAIRAKLAAPGPASDFPKTLSRLPTEETAISIHEEDLADLTAASSIPFRWCADVQGPACILKNDTFSDGRAIGLLERPSATHTLEWLAKVGYLIVVRTKSYTAPWDQGSGKFKGGEVKAEAFLFDLDETRLVGRFSLSATNGPFLSQGVGFTATEVLASDLRKQCREALDAELAKAFPGARCRAGWQ